MAFSSFTQQTLTLMLTHIKHFPSKAPWQSRTPIDRTTPTQNHRKLLYQVRDKCDGFPSNGSDFRHTVYVRVERNLLSEKDFIVLLFDGETLFRFIVFTQLCH